MPSLGASHGHAAGGWAALPRARSASHAGPPLSLHTHTHLQLLANFIYREPGLHNLTSVDGVVDTLRFLCSRDLTIGQVRCVCCARCGC